jgi:hypothetical protein
LVLKDSRISEALLNAFNTGINGVSFPVACQ